MKNYDDLTERLLQRRDRYMAVQKQKRMLITRVACSMGCCVLIGAIGVSLMHSGVFTETPPMTSVTTTVTNTPTEIGDTTTANNATATTTDGTTAKDTTAPTTSPSKTEPPKTTSPSKTEPPATTTTAPTKLLITADEPDTNCIEVSESGVYKHGVISPLLKETMEQYKDTDAVYAVIIAVRYKVKDDYNDAYNAFLASDEMVKLAEQRDLAYEEWKAVDEMRKANIGNEEVIAEIIDDYYRTQDAYRSLRREYEKKINDFQDAHRKAGLDESIALLSEFSDIDLIPLKDRLKSDMEWSEEFPIRCVMIMSESEDYAYAAVLSADEIVELSERIGCMYWLDSYDEDYYIAGMLDE